ncbi:hypothetical protein V8J36_19920 [Frigidibacter sp. MR17.14]|uniref:hypothetical protein n=1 Tax=Frigidibacter sp. MR17.14 TaxID=3126509 RepID=UPI003012E4CB
MFMRYTLRAEGMPVAVSTEAEASTDPRDVFLKLAEENGLVPGQAQSFTRQGPPEARMGFAGEMGATTIWESAPEEEILGLVR